jgi:phage terminase large subunit-like protein
VGDVIYKPDRCEYCHTETWCEMRANGKAQCRGCKVERFFERVLYPPLKLVLLDWQRKVLKELYGTVDMATGLRQFTSAYISVAKKNGKSFLVGGIPIYELVAGHDPKPEIYGGAAAKEQAGLVYNSAKMLVDANPNLRAKLKVLPSVKRIRKRDGSPGFYAVLAADGNLQDGIEPSISIRDEVHRWKTARAETLYDVMTKGQISRKEPIDIAITTAGAEYEAPMWFSEYDMAKRVSQGKLVASHKYVAIWEADRKRVETEPDYWKSLEARIAANPSHEHFGGFLRDSKLKEELEKAIVKPTDKSKFLRYHLNVPITSQEDPVIEMSKWYASGGEDDLREWPTYDYDLLIRKWGLLERPCFAGVDASWTIDLTSVNFIFPPRDGSDIWTVLPFYWLPEKRIDEVERICHVPIAAWNEMGFIDKTPGEIIDQRAVIERIRWGREMFDLQEVPYDRLNFRTEAMNLVDDGINAVEVTQSFLHLSYPTKWLLGAYKAGKLRHGNNPVLNWNASCLQLQYDHKDNCQPAKPERMRSSKRIDGMQALVTGLSRALIAVPAGNSSIEVW